MSPSRRAGAAGAGARPGRRWLPGRGLWGRAAVVLLAGGAVRSLRLWGDFASWAHADDVRNAVPAAQILTGIFPVHHVGVEYHGAAPAYPLAAWFALFGTTTYALDLFCLAVASLIAWTGYLLAARLLPPGPAWLAALILTVPPLVYSRWTMSGNLNYPVNQLLGNLILLGTHTVVFRRADGAGRLFALGLVAGLGWWTNPLVVVACAPIGILALRTGLVWRARFWSFPAGVLVGGLPDWLYQVVNYPSARLALHESGSVAPETPLQRLAMLAGDLSFEIAGARSRALATIDFAPPLPLQWAVLAFAVLAVARAAVRDRGELGWLVGLRRGPGRGASLLWLLVAANLALAVPTQRTLGITYVLPLYAALPVWYGECLAWLWRVRRPLGGAVAAGLLAFLLWSNWTVSLGRAGAAPRWARLHGVARPLSEWLDARGIRHVYLTGGPLSSFEFTFLTGMRIVAASPWAEPVVQHGHAVDAQPSPPFVAARGAADELRATFRGLGPPPRETRLGGLTVFEPRAPAIGFVPVPPARWTIRASHRSVEAVHLADRDVSTQWSSGHRQEPGQWLAVDLGEETEVARVDLLAIDWQEVPAGLRVEWSRDGDAWTEAVSMEPYWGPMFLSEHHPFLRVRRGRVQAIFAPVRARFLRLRQTGRSVHAWSARELFVYRPAPQTPREPPPDGAIVAGLRKAGARMVYASHWLSARVLAEGRGEISALESNINLNSYGRTIPDPTAIERFRPEPGRAVLLGADGDPAGVRDLLARRGMLAAESAVGPYRLLLLAPPPEPGRLPPEGARASATVAGHEAVRALDGDPRTRWVAPGPFEAVAFVVDLGVPRRVSGLRLRPGTRGGSPAAYHVEGSADGSAWAPIEPLEWAGPLYWTGEELLANGGAEWAVRFPPVTVRHLRLRPAAPSRQWVIEEVETFD